MQKSKIKLRRYCLCGAGIAGCADPIRAEQLNAAWDKLHSGEGHGEATPAQSARKRRQDLMAMLGANSAIEGRPRER
jgi:hypothetical protein